MKRVFIVHGWGADPHEDWFPWLKTQLEKKDFHVDVPRMPETDTPQIGAWIAYLAKHVGKPDKDTFFVGHSIGCQTILRYLTTIKGTVGGVVLVAPWFTLKGLEKSEKPIAAPWIETTMNFEKIKKNSIVAFFSDNDPVVPLSNAALFKKRLGAKVVIEKNKFHFGASEGIAKVPEALKAVLDLAK